MGNQPTRASAGRKENIQFEYEWCYECWSPVYEGMAESIHEALEKGWETTWHTEPKPGWIHPEDIRERNTNRSYTIDMRLERQFRTDTGRSRRLRAVLPLKME